jgi:hypothetical protein
MGGWSWVVNRLCKIGWSRIGTRCVEWQDVRQERLLANLVQRCYSTCIPVSSYFYGASRCLSIESAVVFHQVMLFVHSVCVPLALSPFQLSATVPFTTRCPHWFTFTTGRDVLNTNNTDTSIVDLSTINPIKRTQTTYLANCPRSFAQPQHTDPHPLNYIIQAQLTTFYNSPHHQHLHQ